MLETKIPSNKLLIRKLQTDTINFLCQHEPLVSFPESQMNKDVREYIYASPKSNVFNQIRVDPNQIHLSKSAFSLTLFPFPFYTRMSPERLYA